MRVLLVSWTNQIADIDFPVFRVADFPNAMSLSICETYKNLHPAAVVGHLL